MIALNKFAFQKFIRDAELLNKYDDSFFDNDNAIIKDAYKLIKSCRDQFVRNPTAEQFIEIANLRGVADQFTPSAVETLFAPLDGVDHVFLEETLEKKCIIHEIITLNSEINHIAKNVRDNYRTQTKEQLQNTLKGLYKRLDALQTTTLDKPKGLEIYDLNEAF